MTDHVIRVEKISKRYRIGKLIQHENGRSPIFKKLAGTFQYLASTMRKPTDDEIIWALRDVSFEVDRGEVFGIIGRNGAGKSTLLKILSRITEPTSGRAVIGGRVGSLLEIGTGFHPELTGRENVYMSGAILGMKRAEIDRKFDEIVAFAAIEKFLDTPVKRYSSGMYVRLAFAVAAHLDPEILLIDEVLAVGDAAFQKKCLGKMGDVATQGRTVLFVSHNMVAVQNLCQRAVWLDGGQIKSIGNTNQIVLEYLTAADKASTERIWNDQQNAPGNEKVRIRSLRVHPKDGLPKDPISMETPLEVEVEFWNLVPDAFLHVSFQFFTELQIVAFTSASIEQEGTLRGPLPVGLYRSVCSIPGNVLNQGMHRIALLILRNTSRILFHMENALSFEVLELGQRPGTWYGHEPGAVRLQLPWKTEQIRGD